MRDFIFFEMHSTKAFKKLLASGVDFSKVRIDMTNFMKYMSGQFQTNMELYKASLNVDSIILENIIEPKYRFLFKGKDLRYFVEFMEAIEKRLQDFKGKEDALQTMILMYFLFYVLVVKLVDTYLGALTNYATADPNNINYTLKDIGIDNSILRFFANLEDLRQKTIDDWLKSSIDGTEASYYTNALHRIFMILGQ